MNARVKPPKSATPAAPAYDGPPDYRVVGRHGVYPETTHDEVARFNFLAQMNRHLAAKVMPGVKKAFDARVEPAFKKKHDRGFRDRHEVRKALSADSQFQWWSALRRATMENRQQAGRWVVLRQAEALNARAAALNEGAQLELDPTLKLPRYVAAIDHHCMPGSYYTELAPGDVTGPANYDSGIFATTGGMLGLYNDGGGQAIAAWLKKNLPEGFKPQSILDLGAGLGHNVVPIAQAFPDAEIVAVDVGAPMLRYGAARAKSMGVDNIRFVQGDVSSLDQYPDESFDLIHSCMFLHETSMKSMPKIFKETHRLLKPGGLVLHVEQPQYSKDMPLFEQAMRDWDAFYNNEPFWTKMHEIDLDAMMVKSGFAKGDLVHGGVAAIVDPKVFPEAAKDNSQEDYGRKAAWHVVGARKPPAKAKKKAPAA